MLNIDQLKQDICKQSALIELIEKSQQRARSFYSSDYYAIYGPPSTTNIALEKQNMVTERLYKYLQKIIERRSA